MLFASKLGIGLTEEVTIKALKLVDKGLTVTHILAEMLIYSYLKSRGYKNIYIEETVGNSKCDVLLIDDTYSKCIEIETNVVPIDYILESSNYIVARHVKKIIQMAKDGIATASFAYPLGVTPLIPLELLKKPGDRSRSEIDKLFNMAITFFNLDPEDRAYLERYALDDIYIYDIASLKVVQVKPQAVLHLLSMYDNLLSGNA